MDIHFHFSEANDQEAVAGLSGKWKFTLIKTVIFYVTVAAPLYIPISNV